MRKINERKGWDEIKHDNGDKRKINREKEDDIKDDKGKQKRVTKRKKERKTGHQKVRKHGRKDENTGAATETYSIIRWTGTHID